MCSAPGAPKDMYFTMFSAPGAPKGMYFTMFSAPGAPKGMYFTVVSTPGARFAGKFTCKSRFSEIPGPDLHVNLRAKHVFNGMNRPLGDP